MSLYELRLPAAVEGTLEVLLMENQLSSWKVSSKGSKTVVVRVASLLTKFVRSNVVNTAQFIAHNRRSCLLMAKMMSTKTGVCMFAM